MAEMKLGFLPLYLAFYKEAVPSCLAAAEAFAGRIAGLLRSVGAETVEPGVCCTREEISAAVAAFEGAGVDAIVTLHLAYSPSLEAVGPLTATRLPLVVLDTTPDASYLADHSTLMANHGIHGVQDLCNLLLRAGRRFSIVAGYWETRQFRSELLTRLHAARSASRLARCRVGRIGRPFEGMGDFLTDGESLTSLGIETVEFGKAEPPSEERVNAFIAEQFGPGEADAVKLACARAAITVREFLEENKLDAFSFNFQDLAGLGFPGVPFLEASLAMARGIGYAGEGDVLTAAFVAALLASRPRTTFTEMFCPDWTRGLVYLSHMGEINHALLDGVAWSAAPNPFIPLPTPLVGCGTLTAGPVILADLAPAAKGEFTLIAIRGEMVAPEKPDTARVGGYFRPSIPLPEALRRYSMNGGTHHLAAVYDTSEPFFEQFAAFTGVRAILI